MKFEECIKNITEQIDLYSAHDNLDGSTLIDINRIIVTNLYYLEAIRSDLKEDYDKRVYNLIEEGNSATGATKIADKEYPLMYRLRRVMDASYKNVEQIRTHISFLKQELNNLN